MVGTMLGPPRVTEGVWVGEHSHSFPKGIEAQAPKAGVGQPCPQARQLLQSTGDQTQPNSAMATNLATLMVNMGAKGARCPAGM